jgi:hypothetical protein
MHCFFLSLLGDTVMPCLVWARSVHCDGRLHMKLERRWNVCVATSDIPGICIICIFTHLSTHCFAKLSAMLRFRALLSVSLMR